MSADFSALSKVQIILVGHTPFKFRRLRKLVENSIESKPLRIVTVFNGSKGEPCDLHTENDLQMRDVGMYRTGLDFLNSQDHVICLNDDVEYIAPGALEMIAAKLNAGADMVGAQPNLSHWIVFKNLSQKQALFHKHKGRALRFVRTSAFGCTRKYFETLFSKIRSAQEFEKGTMQLMPAYKIEFLEKYDLIYDGNIAEFIPNYQAATQSEK